MAFRDIQYPGEEGEEGGEGGKGEGVEGGKGEGGEGGKGEGVEGGKGEGGEGGKGEGGEGGKGGEEGRCTQKYFHRSEIDPYLTLHLLACGPTLHSEGNPLRG